MPALVLASNSPRRRQLLSCLVDKFICQGADIDETPHKNESPNQLVLRLAQQKAFAVSQSHPTSVILGSDTIIEFNGKIIGKPRDKNDFVGMMTMLSGNWHRVYTGVCVMSSTSVNSFFTSTAVEFIKMNAMDIDKYWDTEEPKDKAGGYAIQGYGGQFVKQIRGSYSAVVGLPLAETKDLLKQCKVIS